MTMFRYTLKNDKRTYASETILLHIYVSGDTLSGSYPEFLKIITKNNNEALIEHYNHSKYVDSVKITLKDLIHKLETHEPIDTISSIQLDPYMTLEITEIENGMTERDYHRNSESDY